MTPEEQRAEDVTRVEQEIRRAQARIVFGTSAEERAESAADRFYGQLDRESGERDVPFWTRILVALTTREPWESLAVTAEHNASMEMDVRRLETALDYVASCFHVAIHGIKDAPTWRECDRQPCRSANGRPSIKRVSPEDRPPTDATPP